jgi:hypothetical protein
MKTKAKFLCSSFSLLLIVMMPPTVRAESAVQLYDQGKTLFEQIQDLELLQRNIEECYQVEKRTLVVASRSGQSWRNCPEFEGKLMNRVFGHLAGTPEYQRFIKAYRILFKSPDFRRLHTDDLFARYMRLLESGRTRFLTQLKEWQKNVGERYSAQHPDGLAQPIPVKRFRFGHAKGSLRNESVRVVPAVRLQVQMPLSASTPLTQCWKGVSRIVVHGMDQSSSASTAASTIDITELPISAALERVVPLEKGPRGYHLGLVKEGGGRSGTLKNLQSSGVTDGYGSYPILDLEGENR